MSKDDQEGHTSVTIHLPRNQKARLMLLLEAMREARPNDRLNLSSVVELIIEKYFEELQQE